MAGGAVTDDERDALRRQLEAARTSGERIGRSLGLPPHVLEEHLQDTYVRLLSRHRAQGDDSGALLDRGNSVIDKELATLEAERQRSGPVDNNGAFGHRAGRNAALAANRSRARERARTVPLHDDENRPIVEPEDLAPDAHARAETAEAYARVVDLVTDERERVILLRLYRDGRRPDEVAAELNAIESRDAGKTALAAKTTKWTPAAVKKRGQRLRERIAEQAGDD